MTGTQYCMGIDGGGSTVRVAITTPEMQICGEAQGSTANPSVVGAEVAAQTIRMAMQDALTAAQLTSTHIAAVGIGVAGAAAHHSATWLREVITGVIPNTIIVPSADFEIALVGALGERHGVLVLAGTGSLVYGVNAAGETALVGGWGYIIDDAGSGYWIGRSALEVMARVGDGRGPNTALVQRILDHLGLSTPRDLVPWLYQSKQPVSRRVAALAPLVIACADEGDHVAQHIISAAWNELYHATKTVMRRLDMHNPRIAFAGGLLTTPNGLSTHLCAALQLPTIPEPRYPPVIGAALLARSALD